MRCGQQPSTEGAVSCKAVARAQDAVAWINMERMRFSSKASLKVRGHDVGHAGVEREGDSRLSGAQQSKHDAGRLHAAESG